MNRVAVVQMTSGAEVADNLRAAAEWIAAAAAAGAKLVALPENFAHMGLHERDKLAIAERPGRGPIQRFLAEQSARHRIWIVGGTIPLLGPGDPRPYAASLVYNALGERVARYDKLHLFDVTVAEAERYQESASLRPGRATPANHVTCDSPIGTLGLSVCYDLRFPELYRRLVARGAQVLFVPAAFTENTGQAHWEVLLRARAVENLCWVIAPGQSGTHANGRRTWGHSMIVSPWGEVRACRETGAGIAVADIDLDELAKLRGCFPALQHRRL